MSLKSSSKCSRFTFISSITFNYMFLKQDQTKSWAVPAVHLTRRLQRSIWRSWKAFKKRNCWQTRTGSISEDDSGPQERQEESSRVWAYCSSNDSRITSSCMSAAEAAGSVPPPEHRGEGLTAPFFCILLCYKDPKFKYFLNPFLLLSHQMTSEQIPRRWKSQTALKVIILVASLPADAHSGLTKGGENCSCRMTKACRRWRGWRRWRRWRMLPAAQPECSISCFETEQMRLFKCRQKAVYILIWHG